MSTSRNAFLPPDLRELIEVDRHAPDPSDAVRQSVAQSLDRRLGLGGAMVAPVARASGRFSLAPKALPAVAPAVTMMAWKIAASVVAVGILSGGGFAVWRSGHRSGDMPVAAKMAVTDGAGQRSKSAVAPPRALVAPVAPIELSLDEPASAAVASSLKPAERHHERAARSGQKSGLADERRMLDRARSALVARDLTRALSVLQSHERAFPRGQLAEEREGMRLQALVLAHDFGSARAAFERFRQRYPHSLFLPALEKALESAR